MPADMRALNAAQEWVGTPAAPAARKSEVVDISAANHTAQSSYDAIYVGVGGDLVCRLVGDSTDRTFKNLIGGMVYPFAISIVTRSGTTITTAGAMILLRER